MSELRDRTKMVLAEHGADDLHSWRCNHPEVYGRCTCLDDMADDLVKLTRLAQAEALEEAAAKWLHGDWGNTPRQTERAADRIGAAQFAGDWMKQRAAAYRVGEGQTDA